MQRYICFFNIPNGYIDIVIAILAQKMSNIVPKWPSDAVLCEVLAILPVGETTIRGGEMTKKTSPECWATVRTPILG